MRNSKMTVAAVCSLAAAFSASKTLAKPFDSGAAAAATAPEAFLGTCGNPDQADTARDSQVKASKDTAEFRITDEMRQRADLNGDGEITVDDLMLLLSLWGNCPVWSELSCQGDIDGNNMIDYNDLSIMLSLLDLAIIPVIEVTVDDPKIEVQVGQASKQH